MKHFILFLSFFMILLLIGCDKNEQPTSTEHVHIYSNEWIYDEGGHWQVCSCGESNEKAIHQWNEGIVSEDSTCTKTGIKVFTCKICSKTKSEIIPMKNHNFDDGVIINEASCMQVGIKAYTCSVCNNTIEKEFFDNSHHYEEDYKYNNTHHWYECECGSIKNKETHDWSEEEITLEASCDSEGEKEFRCICGASKTETINKLDHSFSSEWSHDEFNHWHDSTCGHDITSNYEEHFGGKATCTAEAKCSECGTSYGSLADHVYSEKVVSSDYIVSPATCFKKAVYYYSCKCGAKGEDTFENGYPLEHSYTNYKSNNDAKCGVDGTKTAICDNGCGSENTLTDTGSALEHSYTNYKSNNDAKCGVDGTKTAICDNGCGNTNTITVSGSALEHSYTVYNSNNDAKCGIDGTKTAICDNGCGSENTLTDVGSALNHSYTNYISNNNAKCGVDGTKTAICDNGCGSENTLTDTGSALEHSYTNYKSNNDATCVSDGTKTAICDNGCGINSTLIDEGSKLEHIYLEKWCGDSNYHWKECECGSFTEKNVHNWDDGIVITVATEEVEGLIRYTCQTCEKIKDENTGLLDHTHKFSDEWSFDDVAHWYNSTCGHDVTSNYEVHYGGEASCAEKAKCSICGNSYGILLEHIYSEKVVSDEYKLSVATCTASAVYYYSCKCGARGEDTFEYGLPLDHSYTIYNSNNDAKCGIDGTKTAICDNGCGSENTLTDAGSALDHSYTNYKSNNDAKCGVDGTKTAICDNGCGSENTLSDTGSALDHSYTIYNSNNDAKCEVDGTKTASCDNGCGNTSTIIDEGSALSHIAGASATCTTDQICTRCDKTLVSALGHVEESIWEKDGTYHWKNCSTCYQIISNTKTSHTWDSGKVTTDATTTTTGVKTYTCSVCSGTKTETIEKIPTNISIDKEDIIGLVDEYYYISITNQYNAELVVSNSNSSVVSYTIDSTTKITVKILKEGTAQLSITTANGNTVYVNIKGINLSITSTVENLEVGSNTTITLSKSVSATYSVSNDCATITSSGKVTAVSDGAFYVIVTYGDITLRKRIETFATLSILTKFDRESDYIRYYGRNVHINGAVKMDNTGSGFEVKFYGTELRATLDAWYGLWLDPTNPSNAYTRVSVMIDGSTDTTTNIVVLDRGTAKYEYVLASGLTNGWHTVKVLKRTEALCTDMTLYELRTDGYFGAVDKTEKLKIEVYGDSITAGFGNLRPTSDPDYTNSAEQNGLQTYATYAAMALDAEINVMARSGIGIYTAGGISEPYHVRHLYDHVNYEYDYYWNFSNYTPDIVIINLGTNDNWHWADTNGDGTMEWQFDQTTFETEYVKIVQSLAAKYGSNTSFVLLSGLMEQDVHRYVANIVSTLESSIPNKIVTHNFSQVVYGHPLASEHKTASEQLVNLIKNNGLNVIHSQTIDESETNAPITDASVNTTITVNIKDQLPSYANIVLKGLGSDVTMTKVDTFTYKATISSLKEGDYEISFSLNGNSDYGEIGYPTRYIKVRKGTPNINLTLNTFKDTPENPNPNATNSGWSISNHFHGTNWSPSSTSSVKVTTNTNWLQGFITRKADNTDNYKITANLKATITDYTKSYIGIVPYYKDEGNYIVCYLQWDNASSNSLKSIGCTGFIKGIDIGWHDFWSFQGLTPDLASGVDISVERCDTMLKISFMGVTQTQQIAKMQGDTERVGVWVYSDGQPATISNFAQAKSTTTITTPTNWQLYKVDGSTASFSESNGSVTLNNTNWMDGFLVKNISYDDNYTIEATIKASSDNFPYTSPETCIGLVPYYVDQNDYIVVYIQWNTSGTIKSIGCTGKVGGVDIGWNDFWSFQNKSTSLVSGQTMKVTRNNDKLTVTFAGVTETKTIGALYGLPNQKAGVWTVTNPATFSSFTVTSN